MADWRSNFAVGPSDARRTYGGAHRCGALKCSTRFRFYFDHAPAIDLVRRDFNGRETLKRHTSRTRAHLRRANSSSWPTVRVFATRYNAQGRCLLCACRKMTEEKDTFVVSLYRLPRNYVHISWCRFHSYLILTELILAHHKLGETTQTARPRPSNFPQASKGP